MDEKIIFEDCTNGISWKVQGNKYDDTRDILLVFHDDEKNEGVGKYILENIKCVLDAALCNRAEITINIRPIQD